MPETRSVKLFKNGSSGANPPPRRIPLRRRQVYATRDETTGDVVTPKNPGKKIWEDFFAMLQTIDVPKDFMAERPMNQIPSRPGVFDDLIEEAKPKRKKA